MGEKKPYLAAILVQCIYGVMFLLSKAAFTGGMNYFVFFFYRQAAATLFLVPLAFYFEWKNRPPLSFVTFCKSFMLSLIGITSSFSLFGVGIVYTSASMAAAITNSLPVITFFLALLLGTEVLKLRSCSGIVKLIGVLLCMGGVATLALYTGPHFKLLCFHHLLGSHNNQETHAPVPVPSGKTWIKGCFLLFGSNTLWGLWLVLQARVLKSYPSKLLFTTLQCFQSTTQLFVIAIAVERDPQQWKLGWDVRLLAVAYCVRKALYFVIFCLLGAILLVGGLYSVLWGKGKEERMDDQKCSSRAEVHKEPLELKQIVLDATKGPLTV
ncbi:hypothetical protein Tsubulata_020862 [Turnera subulata]|uniref:WAT1-related protein n=1 Tax=Turnera subulata TaxID=218843 RepID=A0A9Q0J4H8_9ROSI|nr:hypothetical protein Tsubulata_020862 [Turnera subulata]